MIVCEVVSRDVNFLLIVFFFKQKTAYEMRISDWSSDVCSSDLHPLGNGGQIRNRKEAVADPGAGRTKPVVYRTGCSSRDRFIAGHCHPDLPAPSDGQQTPARRTTGKTAGEGETVNHHAGGPGWRNG